MATITEYIFIGLTSLAIAFIIGMSILSLIDKKMSSVSINIPQPNITVKLDDGCTYNTKPKKDDEEDEDEKEKEEKEELVEGFSMVDVPTDDIKNTEIDEKKLNTKDSPKKSKLRVKQKHSLVTPRHLEGEEAEDKMYDDIEGYKQYAVMGCNDRRKKFNLYPNIVSCNQPNYLTAENYYNENFEYPYIPGQSEERWMPADYEYSSYLARPDKSLRIIMRNSKKINRAKNPPFPANYWFK